MLDGKEYTFGVSGKLWRNGLVMYDHQTETLWSGVTGDALLGPLQGKRLKILAALPKIRWQHWKTAYPQSKVLTYYGLQDFDEDQYADYHFSGMTGLFPPEHTKSELHPKALVMGVRIGDQYRAYPLGAFEQSKLMTDRFANTELLVYRDKDSEASAVYVRQVDGKILAFKPGRIWTLIEDTTTGTTWNIVTGMAVSGPLQGKQLQRIPHYNIYWFAWVDFHPGTSLFTPPANTSAGN